MNTQPAPRLYSIKDTCRILNVSKTTAYKMIANGTLLAIKVGRSTRVQASSIDSVVGEAA
ncbi:helix-turn-helix domain-containing protein [Sphingomonas sanguinis]|uniref:Helix-turn-helix domain-containing protein n=1 Tax=Sphingomonas sanguinis TaxID=33051 RepID=A0A147JBY5_9SPHN|nr:helix-turn-helix domain-containing protein [Sphingomonas sanguinis]KTW16600.1 hypothetical protein NS258_03575 [Sphingomonas sanguinis]